MKFKALICLMCLYYRISLESADNSNCTESQLTLCESQFNENSPLVCLEVIELKTCLTACENTKEWQSWNVYTKHGALVRKMNSYPDCIPESKVSKKKCNEKFVNNCYQQYNHNATPICPEVKKLRMCVSELTGCQAMKHPKFVQSRDILEKHRDCFFVNYSRILEVLKNKEPSGPPLDVLAHTKSSTSILVKWNPPSELDRNGVITHYIVTYNESLGSETSITTSDNRTQKLVSSLRKYSPYYFTVQAVNNIGVGPPSVAVINTTAEDTLKCADDEFPCATVCITKDLVCDNQNDCGDNADEIDCDVITAKCPKGELRCDRVKCINATKRCDGEPDCLDGSDEAENNCHKGTSRPFNIGLAVGLCLGILSLVVCAVIGKLWYNKSRRSKKQHVIEPPSGMTARNSVGEEIDAMFTPDHEDNSNGIIDSVQEEGRVQLHGDTTKISSVSRPSPGQVCVDKSKQRFHRSVLPSPTPVDMPAKRTVEPSKPKARKMRSYNIGKDSTCIGQENALHGESFLLKENEESWEIDRERQRKYGNLPRDGEFGVVNKGNYRGQDGRIHDVTAKQFKGEFCVHLSKGRFRTSELPRPIPSDIPAKRTLKFRKPMPRTCEGGKHTRTSVGQSILLKENQKSWEIDGERQRKSDNLQGDGEFGAVNKGSYRGQDGRIYDVTAKRFEGEFCVHLSKERFRTSELPRPTPSDILAKRTLKFRKPMPRTCDSGKDTRTSVGQNNALEGESILLKEKEESWEIDSDRLRVSDVVLGEGEFGIVNKGSYRGQDGRIYDVAVKQLKDGTSMADKNDLLSEIKMLKQAGRHPNIVSLVGVCTREEKILVVTELVPYGSLKNFLISKRIACVSGEASRYVNVRFGLNDRVLLKIAFQIALGMQFLEKKKCVHRDLSARNVFIGENLVAKVGDFGLARDISDYGIYTKISNGRVPWRWLSLESLKVQVYTAKSDVWSYGIVLWEIATYGEEPYPDIETPMDLILWLSMGNRMSRPEHSSEKMYEIMWLCWKENPLMRPTFADITKRFPYYLQRYKNNYMNIPKEDDGSVSEVSLLNGVSLTRTGNMTTTV